MINSFFLAAKSILPLFLVILIGIFFVRLRVVHRGWVDVLNKYALWIGLPSLILVAMIRLDFKFGEYANMILANSGYQIICTLAAYPISFIFKTSLKTKQSLFLLLGYGNISYLGIPLISNALGTEALPSAILLSAVYPIWMFSLAIVLIELSGHEKVHLTEIFRRLVTNPLLISVFLGIIISGFKIPVQSSLVKTLDLFGQSVTAVVLLSLGIFLGSQEIGSMKQWWPVLGLSFAIMVLLPGIFYFVAKHCGMTNLQLRASIIDAAMPMGLTAYAMTEQYQLNALLTGRLVILSTVLAAVIIPAWIVFTA